DVCSSDLGDQAAIDSRCLIKLSLDSRQFNCVGPGYTVNNAIDDDVDIVTGAGTRDKTTDRKAATAVKVTVRCAILDEQVFVNKKLRRASAGQPAVIINTVTIAQPFINLAKRKTVNIVKSLIGHGVDILCAHQQ